MEKHAEIEKAAADARRAYKRKWNREHPEAVREHQRRYWIKKALEAAQEEQGK